MKCPVCSTVNLIMSDRQGVEIDYCPECRGVWLDRGELDKILERSRIMLEPQPEPRESHSPHRHAAPHHHGPDAHRGHYGHSHKPHTKKHWLHELFD